MNNGYKYIWVLNVPMLLAIVYMCVTMYNTVHPNVIPWVQFSIGLIVVQIITLYLGIYLTRR